MSQQIGFAAEEKALHFLIKQGMRYLESNYHCRWGEIDLIMKDKEFVVFVEVRTRSSIVLGTAIETVTRAKQQKIIKTAKHYLVTKKWNEKYPIRFDVIGLDGLSQTINWVKNAF